MKIILCYPPTSDEYERIRDAGLAPHLSLLCLASYARERIKDIDIKIVDGYYYSIAEISQIITDYKPDLVGFSVDFTNYKNAITLADICKENNASVILGSNHASNLYKEILNNRKNIDAIVCNDGEEAFVGYINFLSGRCDIKDIPNLAYRKEAEIVKNPLKIFNLSDMPEPAYDLIDLKKYFRFQEQVFGRGFKMLQFTSQRGCLNFPLCVFCGRYPDGLRLRPPERFAREVIKYISQYDLNEAWDRSDSFVQSFPWIKNFRDTIYKNEFNPFKERKVTFKTYARADQLTNKDVIKILKDLNFRIVFIGYEAGDDRILKNIGKHSNVDIYLKATKNVLDTNLQVDASFIVGLPGENHESLAHHISFVKKLVKMGLRKIRINRLLVLPGTPLYHKVTETFKEYQGLDIYNMQDFQDKLFLTDFYDLKEFGNNLNNFKKALGETAQEMADIVVSAGGSAEGYGHGKDKMILIGREYERK